MRTRKPRLAILNGTCLDVLAPHRAAIEARGVELWADDAYRTLTLEQAGEIAKQVDAVILPATARSFPHAAHMNAAPNLLCCSIAASGFDWLDVAAATRCGIVVTNAIPPEGSEVVADMAFALMLAVARQVPFHHQAIAQGRGDRGTGVSLWRKTLGIVGLGRIGKAVARRARGFDMTVLAASPRIDEPFAREHGVEVVALPELLRRADFVSLHPRLTPEARGMLSRERIAQMKPGAILVNTARQELVDEPALVEAIRQGRLGGAGLDDPPTVATRPLLGLPNVVFTPHLGNRAAEGMHAVFLLAVENAVAVIEGWRPTASLVNPGVYERGLRPSPWAGAQ